METKQCPKCGHTGITIRTQLDGDFPIGKCGKCGHCFMDEKDRERIRERIGVSK